MRNLTCPEVPITKAVLKFWQCMSPKNAKLSVNIVLFSVDKKNQLDVTFCILYFSSNSCSTCFGQPCAHHQKLTTA